MGICLKMENIIKTNKNFNAISNCQCKKSVFAYPKI